MADINNLVEELSKLTVLEAADLVKKLEEDRKSTRLNSSHT